MDRSWVVSGFPGKRETRRYKTFEAASKAVAEELYQGSPMGFRVVHEGGFFDFKVWAETSLAVELLGKYTHEVANCLQRDFEKLALVSE